MKPSLHLLPLAVAALLLAGCQTARPLYYWGNYEPITYESYVKPDKATAEIQIEKLQEDIQKASATNLGVPPGLHAQLGYLYYQQGKLDLAEKEFSAEKALFPESGPFIDRLLHPVPANPPAST